MSDQEPVKFLTPSNDLFLQASIYRSLDVEKQEIRLLRLLPGCEGEAVEAQLVHNVFLSSASIEYHTLSYCAGSPYDTETILIEGITFNAFHSLATALRRIRSSQSELIIWVDQICINQSDCREREEQVMLMGLIFSQSVLTFAYVGEDAKSHNERDAEHLVHRACLLSVPLMQHLVDNGEHLWSFRDDLLAADIRIEREMSDERNSHELESFKTFAGMPFWDRCWIYQEILLSPQVQVIYGPCQIAVEDINIAIIYIVLAELRFVHAPEFDAEHPTLRLFVDIQSLFHLLTTRHDRNFNRFLPAHDLVNLSHRLQCTDPRDRIYSFLGLLDPAYGIRPNYDSSCTVEDAYINAAISIMQHEKSLDLIAHSQGLNLSDQVVIKSCPSWVPTSSSPYIVHLSLEVQRQWDASLLRRPLGVDPAPSSTFDWSFEKTDYHHWSWRLSCTVIDLGTVGENFFTCMVEELSDDELLTRRHECLSRANRPSIYELTGQSLDSAFKSCLLYGEDIEDQTILRDLLPARYAGWTKSFFVTPSGIMGLGHKDVGPDDHVCILMGASMPFILRPTARLGGDPCGSVVVGAAYLHGLMHGEAVAGVRNGTIPGTFVRAHIY